MDALMTTLYVSGGKAAKLQNGTVSRSTMTWPKPLEVGIYAQRAIQVCAAMVFRAASVSHLKALVPVQHRATANGNLEATNWTANTTGPPIGGVLVSAFGAATMVAVDAISFLFSAAFIRKLRTLEPPPPRQAPGRSKRAEITAGWSYILGHRTLRPLFFNGLIFDSAIMWVSPLLTVFMLRELGFPAWQYGLALGIEGTGGLIGALWSKRLTRRHTATGLMFASGSLRCLPMVGIGFAPSGWTGWTLIVSAETLVLLFAGLFNPVFGTYRMNTTDDDHLARVTTAWSISSKVAQPVMVAAGGAIAALAGLRISIITAAALAVVSIAFLPWAQLRDHTDDARNRPLAVSAE